MADPVRRAASSPRRIATSASRYRPISARADTQPLLFHIMRVEIAGGHAPVRIASRCTGTARCVRAVHPQGPTENRQRVTEVRCARGPSGRISATARSSSTSAGPGCAASSSAWPHRRRARASSKGAWCCDGNLVTPLHQGPLLEALNEKRQVVDDLELAAPVARWRRSLHARRSTARAPGRRAPRRTAVRRPIGEPSPVRCGHLPPWPRRAPGPKASRGFRRDDSARTAQRPAPEAPWLAPRGQTGLVQQRRKCLPGRDELVQPIELGKREIERGRRLDAGRRGGGGDGRQAGGLCANRGRDQRDRDRRQEGLSHADGCYFRDVSAAQACAWYSPGCAHRPRTRARARSVRPARCSAVARYHSASARRATGRREKRVVERCRRPLRDDPPSGERRRGRNAPLPIPGIRARPERDEPWRPRSRPLIWRQGGHEDGAIRRGRAPPPRGTPSEDSGTRTGAAVTVHNATTGAGN